MVADIKRIAAQMYKRNRFDSPCMDAAEALIGVPTQMVNIRDWKPLTPLMNWGILKSLRGVASAQRQVCVFPPGLEAIVVQSRAHHLSEVAGVWTNVTHES